MTTAIMAGSPEQKTGEILDQLALQVRRTLKTADRDQVHDLRVATRRFSQALAVLDGSSPHHGIEKIRRKLKTAISLAGAVRDYDIAEKLIAKLKAPARLQSKLERRRSDAERQLLDALRDWVDRSLTAKWRQKITSRKNPPASARHHTLIQAARRFFDRSQDVEGSTRALHKLRIAAKKLRYTMELTPSSGAADQIRLDQIKDVQTKLGDINDYETTRRILTEEGASQKMASELKKKQEKKVRQFRRFWKDQFAGKEDQWLAGLRHPRKRA